MKRAYAQSTWHPIRTHLGRIPPWTGLQEVRVQIPTCPLLALGMLLGPFLPSNGGTRAMTRAAMRVALRRGGRLRP